MNHVCLSLGFWWKCCACKSHGKFENEKQTEAAALLCWFWAWACVSLFFPFPPTHFPLTPIHPLSQGIFISQLRTELDGSVGMCSAFLNNRIRERQLRGGTAPTHSSTHPPRSPPPPPPPPRPPSPAINQTMQQTHAWPKGWGRSPPAFCLLTPTSCPFAATGNWHCQLGPAIDWIYLHSHGRQKRRTRWRLRGLGYGPGQQFFRFSFPCPLQAQNNNKTNNNN